MGKFIIKKLLGLIPMLILITFIIYLGLELTPGDAVSHMISPEMLANVDPEKLDEIRAAYGLNDSFILRYFRWHGEILRGNFGYSVSSGVPIIDIIKDLLPATLELAIAALLISTILGSALGLFSAIHRGTFSENLLTVAGMIGVSIPQFFFGMVCILIFSLNLGWLPVGGRMMPGKTAFIDRYEYLILPALVLGISLTAGVMRYARSSMLDTMNAEELVVSLEKNILNSTTVCPIT